MSWWKYTFCTFTCVRYFCPPLPACVLFVHLYWRALEVCRFQQFISYKNSSLFEDESRILCLLGEPWYQTDWREARNQWETFTSLFVLVTSHAHHEGLSITCCCRWAPCGFAVADRLLANQVVHTNKSPNIIRVPWTKHSSLQTSLKLLRYFVSVFVKYYLTVQQTLADYWQTVTRQS